MSKKVQLGQAVVKKMDISMSNEQFPKITLEMFLMDLSPDEIPNLVEKKIDIYVTQTKPTPQGVREFVTGQDGELIEVTTHG